MFVFHTAFSEERKEKKRRRGGEEDKRGRQNWVGIKRGQGEEGEEIYAQFPYMSESITSCIFFSLLNEIVPLVYEIFFVRKVFSRNCSWHLLSNVSCVVVCWFEPRCSARHFPWSERGLLLQVSVAFLTIFDCYNICLK